MPRIGTAVSTLFFLAAVARGGDAPHPALVCAEPVFDAGPVRSGKPLAHTFTFVNRGTGPVDIVEVKPNCGCLTPRLARRRYRPGEAGSVRIEANTLTQPEGRHAWSVRLRYRPADTPGEEQDLLLMVRARIRADIGVRPASLILRTTHTVSHPITFRDRRPRPLTITAAYTTRPQLQARLGRRETTATGTTRTIHLDVLPSYPEGRYEERVYLVTDDPEYRELWVPVTVVKTSPRKVRLAPAALTVRAAAGRPVPSQLVRLRGGATGPVVIERAQADHPALRCRWAQGPGRDATLKVLLDPGQLRAPGFNATVTIHLRQPAGQTVTLPVRCLVEP
jgi:hypothetical protein